jgi:hypothetical protein
VAEKEERDPLKEVGGDCETHSGGYQNRQFQHNEVANSQQLRGGVCAKKQEEAPRAKGDQRGKQHPLPHRTT